MDDQPGGLQDRGSRLWNDLRAQGQFTPAERVIAEEACRIVDRLDRLHKILDGSAEDWIDLRDVKGNPEIVEIHIDKPLAEARQQALALKQLLTELRVSRGAASSPAEEDDFIDELAARRTARVADTAGR